MATVTLPVMQFQATTSTTATITDTTAATAAIPKLANGAFPKWLLVTVSGDNNADAGMSVYLNPFADGVATTGTTNGIPVVRGSSMVLNVTGSGELAYVAIANPTGNLFLTLSPLANQ